MIYARIFLISVLKICVMETNAQTMTLRGHYSLKDSVYEFTLCVKNFNKDPQPGVTYYSFQNSQLIAQTGARSRSYLHGQFENRSYTTNRLYAKGEFRFGLKHGEWRIWDRDGKLTRIEKWKKGKLVRRHHTDSPEPKRGKRKTRLLFWKTSNDENYALKKPGLLHPDEKRK